MRMLRSSLGPLAFVLVCVASQSATGQKLLHWKLHGGEKLALEMKQQIGMELTMFGAPVKVSTDMLMEIDWNVTHVADDGVMTVEQTIRRITMAMTAPGMEPVEFDSDTADKAEGAAKELAKGITPLLAGAFTQRMRPTGEVVDVQLTEQAARAFEASPAAGQLKSIFTKDGLKNLTGQVAAELPSEPVSKGDTWNRKLDIKLPQGQFKADVQYTYAGTERQGGVTAEKIDVEMTLDFGEGMNLEIGQGGPMQAKVQAKSQDNTGVMYFDADAGRLLSTKMTQDMTLQTKVGDTVIDQKVRSTMEMTLRPAK